MILGLYKWKLTHWVRVKAPIDSVAIVKEKNKWSTTSKTCIHLKKQNLMCIENFSASYENAVQYTLSMIVWHCVKHCLLILIALCYCDYVNDNIHPEYD